MATSYIGVLNLVAAVDERFRYIISELEKESKDRSALEEKIKQTNMYIASLQQAISTLSKTYKGTDSPEFAESEIDKYWRNVQSANNIRSYIKEANRLATLYYDSKSGISFLQNEQKLVESHLKYIKNHRHYKTWIRNSDKLDFNIIPNAMPDRLSAYSEKAIDLLVSYGAKVLWEPYKRYMFYYFYLVYKRTVHDQKKQEEMIEKFSAVENTAKELIHKWMQALNNELQKTIELLSQLNKELDEFNGLCRQRMLKRVDSSFQFITQKYDPSKANQRVDELRQQDYNWRLIDSKSEICRESREEYILTYYHGSAKTALDANEYVSQLAQKISNAYSTIFHIQGKFLEFEYPMLMNLDTLRFRMAFNISSVSERTRTTVNGLVQSMVAATIANLPVGKAKFIFADPSNTGVFSNFRDVGKNESEGSRLSSYIVDVNGIRNEFERLSNQIGYTINNILKGTKTTLFKHNQERSFNISPYEFLFIMDYPQNMTAQSLQALKNIVDNGPKCGIFTFIFNVEGTAAKLLKPEEKNLADEIAQPTFVMRDGAFCDSHNSELPYESEISTERFDRFVSYYNEATKESKQPIVRLSELSGQVCADGEYKIPIGKNLGGELEYMSFFGSCQDYLMSGATRIGKTNALHIIIYNTIRYVPNAELYLVDFKQGVEFAPYARLNHPVIKALAVESVPEFGYAVLKHIEDKIKAIGELFINNSVKNWKEYYEKTKKVIPVTIVILDEFQHLFDTEVGKECSRIIEVIAKEGGAFNVHIILATQSMSNVGGLTPAAKDNIFGRMVFYHSEHEYNAMLWNDSHLAMTLNSEVKGQMVFATGDKASQRLLQWAMAKPVDDVVDELGKSLENGRYPTKLLLSTVQHNPFTVFNAIINGKYSIEYVDSCEITLGNEVDVFSGELRKQLDSTSDKETVRYIESSYLKLIPHQDENILFVGSDESIAESCFQLSIYSVLAKQVAMGKKHSIVVIAPELAYNLVKISETFEDYIDFYGQEDSLSDINLAEKEFVFVFGLQNFRSLSYQPDSQLINARQGQTQQILPGGLFAQQSTRMGGMNDGQMFQSAIESDTVHVIAWHNSMSNLSTMFGGDAKVADFLCKFKHKIGLKMEKKDSILFVNSDSCAELSKEAALYVKLNRERVIRPYKGMDSVYCETLNSAIKKLKGDDNFE